MPSTSTNTAPSTMASKVSELSRAFVDAKPSKKAAAKGAIIPEAKDIDIRSWHVSLRSALRTTPSVSILVGDIAVAELPKPLLKVTSVKFDEIYKDDQVKLPEGTDEDGVVRLINHLKAVMNSRGKRGRMRNNLDTFESLSVCVAAKLLGVDKYVDHVFKKCDAYFHTVELPTYDDLEALIAFPNDYERFFHLVIQNLAKKVRDEEIPDIEDFNDYLSQHSVIADAIKKANDKHNNWVRTQATWEERQQRNEEARVRREMKDNEKAERKEVRDKERKVRDDAFWSRRKAEDAADSASIKQKLAGPVVERKFTAQERSYWIRTRGVNLPKGA